MGDFDKYPYGKDQEYEAGMTIDGKFYTNSDLIRALGKALIKKGVVSKAEVKAEL